MNMFKLKTISADAIPDALEKARCFRFLGEPLEAESICRDVLAADPDNGPARALLLLALTDQFDHRMGAAWLEAQEIIERMNDAYSKAYYTGILYESRAKTYLNRGRPGSGRLAYESFKAAMEAYETAENTRVSGDADAALRWNTCARAILRNPEVEESPKAPREEMLE
jgi:tetratricopeptide (TPR) repeat protein